MARSMDAGYHFRCLSHITGMAALTVLALVLGGCEKKSDESGSAAEAMLGTPADSGAAGANLKPVNPNDSAQAQEQARMAVALAMRRGIQPPPPAMKLRGGERATPEVLAAYNQELLRVRIRERESPETLEELVQKWIRKFRWLPNLPTPPPGKRIVYDDRNCIIRLEPP